MRILYGVVGEGMGHATRSAVVIDHLLSRNHEVRVVVSGKAHGFLLERYRDEPGVEIDEIVGLTLHYFENRLQRTKSLFWNLSNAPKAIRKNVGVYRKVAEANFRPQLVISDFESWAALYGLRHGLPVVSIDNMQIVNRCRHAKKIRKGKGFDFRLARTAVRMKVPKAYHYLISSFFFPPVRKRFTTLVPPILRKEIVEAKREPGDHVLVYQKAQSVEQLLAMLRTLPYPFRVYGTYDASEHGNVSVRPFSASRFLEDLRTARAVVAGGGFSLTTEAIHLHVPIMVTPIERQYEQELNARYLEHLGYGRSNKRLTAKIIDDFVSSSEDYARSLSSYVPRDNSMLFGCVDELIARTAAKKKRPKRLSSPNMGCHPGSKKVTAPS
jgi:uncharacterized protein (TIGR00661 family)